MGIFRAIIAGGGTGGHLFPGIAVARELENQLEDSRVLFIVGRRKMEMDILHRYGCEKRSIDVEGLKGRGMIRGAGVLSGLPKGVFQSGRILREASPHVVLGVGGYAAGPVCLAARFLRIPTAIHEQNSYPGLTNRMLARMVDRVLISYEESREYFASTRISLTGNPVRQELLAGGKGTKERSERFTILVLGGSQGAEAVNRSFVDALVRLRELGLAPAVIHQTGHADHARVQESYRTHALEGDVLPFIDDMAGTYGRAHVVVSRAGATTLSELTALGKASILVPYPYAANDHQDRNARALERTGGAIVMDQKDITGERLAETLEEMMKRPEKLTDMGRAALAVGRRDAARQIVKNLFEISLKW